MGFSIAIIHCSPRAGDPRHLARSDAARGDKLKDAADHGLQSGSSTWIRDALRQLVSADSTTKDVLARWTDVLTKLESDPMQLSASSTGHQAAAHRNS